MRRGRRFEKLARQIAVAQRELAEATVRLVGAGFDRDRTAHYIADTHLRGAEAAIARARRGLELLRDEETVELRQLDAALAPDPASARQSDSA